MEYMTEDESFNLEYKKSLAKLSDDLFETYSAFANSNGGTIILGVGEEEVDGSRRKYPIKGIQNVNKQEEQLVNLLSDKNKVSFKTKFNIQIQNFGDKKCIELTIFEAPDKEKPVEVYKKGKWQAYLREGTVDKEMTRKEYQTFIRNQSESLDAQILLDYSMDDLDLNSVNDYRRRVEIEKRYAHYKDFSLEEFLKQIGVLDRSGKGVTVGGLLFFGKSYVITQKFPSLQMDLFDKRTKERWRNRISTFSDDLNVYQFFIRSNEYLQNIPENPFVLDENQRRIEVGDLLRTALREALINLIMHTDYFSEEHEIINIYSDRFDFINAGKMKVSAENFFLTNDSMTRNPVIAKLLKFMGFGELAGSGGEQIFNASKVAKYRLPNIYSDSEKTVLIIWTIDFADSLEDLEENEKVILKFLSKTMKAYSKAEIMKKFNLSSYYAISALNMLVEKEYIQKIGKGRGVKYELNRTLEQKIAFLKQEVNDLRL